MHEDQAARDAHQDAAPARIPAQAPIRACAVCRDVPDQRVAQIAACHILRAAGGMSGHTLNKLVTAHHTTLHVNVTQVRDLSGIVAAYLADDHHLCAHGVLASANEELSNCVMQLL